MKRNDADVARALDAAGPPPPLGAIPARTKLIVITQRTKLPLIILAGSIAILITAFASRHYQQSLLAAERRQNEKRFIQILESGPHPMPRSITNTVVKVVSVPVSSARTKPTPLNDRSIPSRYGTNSVPAFTVERAPASSKSNR